MSVLKANSDGIVTHSHSFYFIFSANQKNNLAATMSVALSQKLNKTREKKNKQ